MRPFVVHEGIAVPLRMSSIDTDQILPSRFLKRVTRSGFGDGLFIGWRQSPDFVLNQPAYVHATVLVAGKDFGIGSSREAAVWALQDYGFRAVIAPRFGDIFRTNAGKAGLVAVELAEAKVERLWDFCDAHPGAAITIDLEARTVIAGDDFQEVFTIDDYVRWRLLNGLDEIAITLTSDDAIAAFESQRPRFKPRVVES
jgi:3-isopropylmalate/(R)-2-methylmalate dehydratase small subunit